MKLSKTNAEKFLRIIEKSNKKVFTCDNLSKATGIKQEVIFDYIEPFYEMIRLDPNHNLKENIADLENYIQKEEKVSKKIKKKPRISHNEYKQYKGFLDYVSKNMTCLRISQITFDGEELNHSKYYLEKIEYLKRMSHYEIFCNLR